MAESVSSSNEGDETPEEYTGPIFIEIPPPAPVAQSSVLGTDANISSSSEGYETPVEIIDLTLSEDSPLSQSSMSSRSMDTPEKGYKCPICFDFASKWEPMHTPCGHVYCKDCIQMAIRASRKCPICRKRLKLKGLKRIFL